MRRSVFAFLVALGTILGLSGCDCAGETPNNCTSSGDCPAGSDCIDGNCRVRTDSGPRDSGGELFCEDLDLDGHAGRTAECPAGPDCDDGNIDVSPSAREVCDNGRDDDCDDQSDEPDCECRFGERAACYAGPDATAGVGACRRGVRVCGRDGTTGECLGQILPGEESTIDHCDGVDNDCDGAIDEGLRNACGECAPEREETCGNDTDDDCDGYVDEGCDCDFRCGCAEGTSCECRPPTNQPCYDGPFGTDGNGVCRGGRRDCVVDAVSGDARWAACAGQVGPAEECAGGVADGVDQDCDGVVDEGCRDEDGDGSPWPTDCNDADASVRPGATETCNGRDDDCDGVPDEGVTNGCGGCGAPAASETCENGLDDDCNGGVDDGCACAFGGTQDCYGGPDGTAGIGACTRGTQTCGGSTEFPEWGACDGQVVPGAEVCNGVDDDCDGEIDERWAVGSNPCGFCDPTEICDGLDQDCDGLVDEGVANRCGDCGAEPVEVCNGTDDDCDGVIDEGVVNACGLCPPEPCFEELWDTPADCAASGRECDSVEESPDYPGSITLGQSISTFDYIYIAVTGRNMVAQMDTTTGTVNWLVPSHGRWPSRTAVAMDGSVWVGNRAFTSSDPNDPAQSNVVHLSATDGSLICRAPVTGIARGVAIDGMGDVWAGTYNGMQVFHISGTDVDTSTTPPTCRVIRVLDVGRNVYGLTVDPSGYVWTSSTPTVRINTRDYGMTTITNPTYYGIAPDGAGNIWFGDWNNNAAGPVHAIRSSDGTMFPTAVNDVTAVTVHPDGTVWGSQYGANRIVGINPTTGAQICTGAIPAGSGNSPHGVAVDRLGRLWMPSRFGSGAVNVFDTSCRHLATYVVDPGQELYSYSDMTGHLLRTFTAPEGTWSQVFDSGYALASWSQVEWDSIEPAGTGIEITVRSADDPSLLDAATPCGPFRPSPANLSTCGASLHGHRYLRVDARLFRAGTTERPVLHEVRAFWAY